ncbi:hypothetical protein Ddye_004354 [Dipteronia dyeriana]|uniref:Uncharacterized protein n=1 Tax=Dipteronia dyeriana TaxID=168575 RepID=A0AAD9XUR5_9ROSI|nr:hypothetical protein Ddye_004354 [Dipteronia dyeriana]
MNDDELFPVEAEKFGYEPKSIFKSISLAAVIQTQLRINPPQSRFTPAPKQSRQCKSIAEEAFSRETPIVVLRINPPQSRFTPAPKQSRRRNANR